MMDGGGLDTVKWCTLRLATTKACSPGSTAAVRVRPGAGGLRQMLHRIVSGRLCSCSAFEDEASALPSRYQSEATLQR